MHTPRKYLSAVLAVAAVAVTGCTSSYDERMRFLRKVAQRGADNYALITSQEAAITKERCTRAYKGIGGWDDAPAYSGGPWAQQIEEYFVDSCVSGKPKPVPGDLPYPSPTVSPPTSSPSSQATKK